MLIGCNIIKVGGLSYKQKEISPRSVAIGKTDKLATSHFSLNLLILQADILV